MAQTGYSPILIYSSSTVAAAPAVGNLINSTLGSELAINITDGKLFYKDNTNAIQVIAWKVTPTTAGGTGLTSYSQGDLLYYNAGTTLTTLAKNTTATRYLSNTGSNNNPAWAQIDLSNGVTGTLPTSNGGTGLTSFTANGVVYASSTSALATGSALTFNGTNLSTTGNVVIATSGNGVDFSVTSSGTGTMTSELLDDYEEGTFTPTIVGATVAGTGTYSEQNGFYTKVGNRVMVNLALTWSAHTGTGNMRISGLPFNNENTTGNLAIPSLYVSNIALTAGNTVQAFVNVNGTQILLYQVPTGGGASVQIPIDTAGTIYVSMQYQTAS